MYTIDILSEEKLNEYKTYKKFVLRGINIRDLYLADLVLKNVDENIFIWMPSYKRKIFTSKGFDIIDEPAFKGYCFVFVKNFNGNLTQALCDYNPYWSFLGNIPRVRRGRIINRKGTSTNAKVIGDTNVKEPFKVSDEELQNVISALIEFNKKIVTPFSINDKVKITSGPLQSVIGYVKDIDRISNEVIVEIEFIGRQVEIEILKSDLCLYEDV